MIFIALICRHFMHIGSGTLTNHMIGFDLLRLHCEHSGEPKGPE